MPLACKTPGKARKTASNPSDGVRAPRNAFARLRAFIGVFVSSAFNRPRLTAANEGEAGAAATTTPAANALDLAGARTLLAELLGLAANATDAAIRDAHAALPGAGEAIRAANNRRAAVLTALGLAANATNQQIHDGILAVPGRLTTAANEASGLRTRLANALMDGGVRDGRITPAERGAWEADFARDFAATEARLANAKPAMNTRGIDRENGGRRQTLANAQERQSAVLTAVNAKMKSAGMNYEEAFAAVEAEMPHVFAQMTKPAADTAK